MICADDILHFDIFLYFMSRMRFCEINLKGRSTKKVIRLQSETLFLAGVPGFEPRLTESESAVLPLDDTPMNDQSLQNIY